MPRYRHAKSRPIHHLAEGERWPNGRMRDDEPSIEAVHAQAMGQRLHYHMSGYTNKEIAERADITENALSRLMRGEAWGTLPVVVRLEQALGADLWCGKAHPADA